MATSNDKHTVHWFRKGLRLHDNPSLREGLKAATTFRCVFIIDPWFAGSSNVGINKWRFLLQCLEDLDRSLRKLNSRLFVIRGQPADALPKLFKEWGTTSLTFEEDPEPFGRVRDHNIMAMCREIGITVVTKVSHTLYKLDKIIEKNAGRAPLTYHQFQTIISGMDAPSMAETTITASNIGNATTPLNEDHDEKYGVPTLEELGFDTDGLLPPVWVGGETEALTRLERHLERKAWVASFGRPKMTPQSLLASQTGLSPYLRFGCLSTRLFYYQLTDLYKRIKRTRPPLSLHGQLLWREFFYCAATKNPNFDKMVGNPICVQIPWDKNSDALAKWANGQTGFPWIDAIMIQLREEGWIHHLARHAVACFLTRGDLWISWEEGMKVFEELLLDADWSVNAGTWMWFSCSSFFQQFFHCYCPVRFGRKADPYGDYIRKYIPVLKSFPTEYIHSPWLAPEEVQENSCCIIGRDYPLPMVNHATASQANIQRIKQVYRKLVKYKSTGDDSNKGGSLIHTMINNSINKADMPASSSSPNIMMSDINHCCMDNKDYLVSIPPENQNAENKFHQNQTENEREDISTNKKYDDDYENCNKTVTDIFEENQQRNVSGLQMCNMPYKKIVVVGQNYDNNIKQEQILDENMHKMVENYDNDNQYNDYKAPDMNYQQQNTTYYNSQKETYSHGVESQMNQNVDYQNTSNTSYNMPVSPQNNDVYDMNRKSYYFTKIDAMKNSMSLDSNYKINYSGSHMESHNVKAETENETINYNQNTQQINPNYNYNMQKMDSVTQMNYQNQNTKIYNENETHYESNMTDDMTYGSSKNEQKNHDCTLAEEQDRFRQGKTVMMQGCSRPEM